MYSRSRLTAHQSKKFVTHKKIQSYLFGFLIIAGFFIFLFLLSKFTNINAFAIKDIVVIGINEEIATSIKKEVKNIIDGSYLGLFSKSNSFLYPHDKLVANIQASVPQIQSLSIGRNGFSGLKINIVPKNPVARVCTTLPEFSTNHTLDSNSNCYLADWSGQIFDYVTASSSVPENLYYVPALADVASSSNSIILSYATSSNEFIALQSFYKGSRDANLRPLFILIKENGEYEMYANDVIIYFNNLRPMEEQLSNLISFWNHEMGDNLNKKFEYIDVRYGSNVFFRLMQ